jgi:UDP-2-acetamido-3-amino-2,3-dideoxy-glucuronate N-acetyltransferase
MMKIGLIGAGAWGKHHLRVWSGLGALGKVCEVKEDILTNLKQQFQEISFTSLLHELTMDPEIRGIVIATPAETHFRLAKECLLAGKDVFVEKPLALNVEEGKQLVTLAAKQNRLLMVGHLLQYHPAVRKLKELIQQGELGRISYVYSNRLNFGRIRTEENILWSFAPHDISVILGLLDEMPVRVSSSGGNYLHKSIADVTVSYFQFKSGANAHIFVSWLHPFKEQKLVVVGERQMAVFDDISPDHKLLLYPHRINWVNRQPVPEKALGVTVEFSNDEPLKAECLHFLECLQSRHPPSTDGEEGLRVLSILTACQHSLEQNGTPIETNIVPTGWAKQDYFVHPTTTVDTPCKIGSGTKIWHYSHIMKDCEIGRNCTIGQNVVVSPGCVLGENVKIQNNVSVYTGVICEDNVFLGPSMVFTNVCTPRSHVSRRHAYQKTRVAKGATIGANATILCGHTIGRFSFVGAGAVVTKDVPDYALVIGNPARQVGWMCECGEQIQFQNQTGPTVCGTCQAGYEKKDEQVLRIR